MYLKTTLANGLRLLTHSMPHTHSVCLAFFIGVGSRYEDEKESGISHFVEHLLFKGTTKRPTSKDISEAIEGVGGVLNGGTDKELTSYWAKVASHNMPLALDVLTDLLRNSRCLPEDMERERQIIVEEINMSLDSPQCRCDMLIDELMWPEQPLGRDVAGTKHSVKGLDRHQVMDFISGTYLPNNTVVSIAGNIDEADVIAMVERALGDWAPGTLPVVPPALDQQDAPRVRIEPRDTEQVHVSLGVRGLPLSHSERYPLGVMNAILGEGMSSRLFVNVRERRGLAYDIHSYLSHFIDSGSVVVYAGVHPGQVKTAIGAVLEELAQLKESIPEQELTKAKEMSKGRLVLRMEDSHSVSGWMGAHEILLGRVRTIDEVLADIDKVTAEDVKKIARQLLVTDKLNLAIVGPIPKDEPLVELLKF